MSLNIKNERTHALVRELAERTGLSQTSAVEEAVRRRLHELDSEAVVPEDRPKPAFSPLEIDRRIAAMERIAAEFQTVTTAEQRRAMADHAEWLYDAQGLPR